MSLSENRDSSFLHGLKQSGLGLGGCAVDLVGQNDIGKERSGLEDELSLAVLFLQYWVPRDVTGKQVGCELNPASLHLQDAGKPLYELGLAEPGETLQKNMATGENARKDQLNQLFLSEKDLLQGVGEGPDVLAGVGDFGFRGVLHGVQGKMC